MGAVAKLKVPARQSTSQRSTPASVTRIDEVRAEVNARYLREKRLEELLEDMERARTMIEDGAMDDSVALMVRLLLKSAERANEACSMVTVLRRARGERE